MSAAPDIAFRPLSVDDLQQVFLWLLQPHVVKWYAPAPSSFMEVAAKYGPRTRPGNPVKSFIVSVDGADAGYIQAYDVAAFPDYEAALQCEKGVSCIDFFIGEASLLDRGIGSEVARRFVEEHVFASPEVRACIAGPPDGQAAAIRAFENAGFRRWKVVKMEGAAPECVLRRDR